MCLKPAPHEGTEAAVRRQGWPRARWHRHDGVMFAFARTSPIGLYAHAYGRAGAWNATGAAGSAGSPPTLFLAPGIFLCFSAILETLGPGKRGWGVQSAIFHRSRGPRQGLGRTKCEATPAGLLSYPYINGGGGLVARWLASPHIRRLLSRRFPVGAPQAPAMAEQVDGFDGAPCLGPAWAPPSRWIWW